MKGEARDKERIRIVLLGSYYRGFYCLDELLHGRLKERVQVVGVATDKVTGTETKRIWKYTTEGGTLVEHLTRAHGIEVYQGKIKAPEFYAKLREWDPEVGVMATFGQLLNERIFGYPGFGFYNLHPSDLPLYRGPDPFGDMIKAGEEHTKVTMHRVDAGFDTGGILAKSYAIRVPPNATPVDMHKITSVSAARLMARGLEEVFEGRAAFRSQPTDV